MTQYKRLLEDIESIHGIKFIVCKTMSSIYILNLEENKSYKFVNQKLNLASDFIGFTDVKANIIGENIIDLNSFKKVNLNKKLIRILTTNFISSPIKELFIISNEVAYGCIQNKDTRILNIWLKAY